MIAALALLAALAFFAPASWPDAGLARTYVAALVFDLGYTIFSEWLNTSVKQSWTYSQRMPVLPMLGTSLSPLLQWVLVPTVALWIAVGRRPWVDRA